MVIQCVVFKCSNRQGSKAKEKGVSFFRFPKDRRKRAAWIKTINRNWAPNEYSRVCSEHFVDSWHSDDPTDIKYCPTLFSYKTREPTETQAAREERHSKRNLLQEINETDRTERLLMQKHHDFSLYSHSYHTSQPDCLQDINNNNDENMILDDVDIKTLKDEGVQCGPDPLLQENLALKKQLDDLKRERSRYIWKVEKIANDDAKTKFYTGLPSFAVFMWLFNSIR